MYDFKIRTFLHKRHVTSHRRASPHYRSDVVVQHGRLNMAYSTASSAHSLVILVPDGRTTNVIYTRVLR